MKGYSIIMNDRECGHFILDTSKDFIRTIRLNDCFFDGNELTSTAFAQKLVDVYGGSATSSGKFSRNCGRYMVHFSGNFGAGERFEVGEWCGETTWLQVAVGQLEEMKFGEEPPQPGGDNDGDGECAEGDDQCP